MKVCLQHPDSKVRVARFSELATWLRQNQCVQDRSSNWTPAAKVERLCKRWAAQDDLELSVTPTELTIVL